MSINFLANFRCDYVPNPDYNPYGGVGFSNAPSGNQSSGRFPPLIIGSYGRHSPSESSFSGGNSPIGSSFSGGNSPTGGSYSGGFSSSGGNSYSSHRFGGFSPK
jgi:hypothetical protein